MGLIALAAPAEAVATRTVAFYSLDEAPGSTTLVDSSGNTVTLETSGITVTSPTLVRINALALEVSASMVTFNVAVSKFTGLVQAETLICNSVVSASYTPGAGNIW